MTVSPVQSESAWLASWFTQHERELHRYPEEEYAQLLRHAADILKTSVEMVAIARSTLEALDILTEVFTGPNISVALTVLPNVLAVALPTMLHYRGVTKIEAGVSIGSSADLGIGLGQPFTNTRVSICLNPTQPDWQAHHVYVFELTGSANLTPPVILWFAQPLWAIAYQKAVEPFHIPTHRLAWMRHVLSDQAFPLYNAPVITTQSAEILNTVEQAIQPHIQTIQPYIMGRGVKAMARELNKPESFFVKLASNEHPDGLPPGFADALVKAAEETSDLAYDQLLNRLQVTLAEPLGLSADNILLGTGSVDLIKAAVTALTPLNSAGGVLSADMPFAMYPFEATKRPTAYECLPLKADYQVDLPAFCEAMRQQPNRMVVLENPRNPLGTSFDDVGPVLEALAPAQILLLDEAYDGFIRSERPDFVDGLALLCRYPHQSVLVQRTFSKSYAMASFRLGYAFGPVALVNRIRQAQWPGSVDRYSLLAGLTVLQLPGVVDWQKQTFAQTTREKQRFYQVFDRLGLRYIPSAANFIYVECGPLGNSQVLFTTLAEQYGVIIRPVKPDSFRVSIGNPTDNQRFLDALTTLIALGD